MEFDLMCEFYDRMKEPKKGFEYFPRNWQEPFYEGEEFIDFAQMALEETGKIAFPFYEQVDLKNYTGFVNIHYGKSKKLENFFQYYEGGKLKYSQSENYSRKLFIKRSLFVDDPFLILRFYFGSSIEKILLNSVKRIAFFKHLNNVEFKVSQHSRNLFEVEILKKEELIFSFTLNDKTDLSGEYRKIIKRYPLIFYDEEGMKEYLGKIDVSYRKNSHKKFKFRELLDTLKEDGI